MILLLKLQLYLSRRAYSQAQDLWFSLTAYTFLDFDIAYVWQFFKLTLYTSTPPIQDQPALTTWFKNFLWQAMVFIVLNPYELPCDHASGLSMNDNYNNYDLIPPPLAWGLKVIKAPLPYLAKYWNMIYVQLQQTNAILILYPSFIWGDWENYVIVICAQDAHMHTYSLRNSTYSTTK